MGIEALTPTCGEIIAADATWKTLADVPDDVIRDRFKATGVLVLRGFGASVEQLDRLARRFSIDLMPGAGRSTFAEYKLVHMVNESMEALEPHTDNGTRPESFRPAITWMMCEQPSESDGETTVFDGVAIWNRLCEDTRARLRAQRLTFSTRYPQVAWRAMGFRELGQFRTFVQSIGGTLTEVDANGTVAIDVSSFAHRRTTYGAHDAFVCSLSVAGSKGFEQLVVRFEDGTDIPEDTMREIKGAIAATCELIRWRAGDYAMLDNTRILHGRRAYRDARRRMYLLQTHHASF